VHFFINNVLEKYSDRGDGDGFTAYWALSDWMRVPFDALMAQFPVSTPGYWITCARKKCLYLYIPAANTRGASINRSEQARNLKVISSSLAHLRGAKDGTGTAPDRIPRLEK
jgi:hypothetical protein